MICWVAQKSDSKVSIIWFPFPFNQNCWSKLFFYKDYFLNHIKLAYVSINWIPSKSEIHDPLYTIVYPVDRHYKDTVIREWDELIEENITIMLANPFPLNRFRTCQKISSSLFPANLTFQRQIRLLIRNQEVSFRNENKVKEESIVKALNSSSTKYYNLSTPWTNNALSVFLVFRVSA